MRAPGTFLLTVAMPPPGPMPSDFSPLVPGLPPRMICFQQVLSSPTAPGFLAGILSEKTDCLTHISGPFPRRVWPACHHSHPFRVCARQRPVSSLGQWQWKLALRVLGTQVFPHFLLTFLVPGMLVKHVVRGEVTLWMCDPACCTGLWFHLRLHCPHHGIPNHFRTRGRAFVVCRDYAVSDVGVRNPSPKQW